MSTAGVGPVQRSDLNESAITAAARAQAWRPTPGLDSMASYLAAQVHDDGFRSVDGPLLEATSCNGVVLHRGRRIASWGRPDVPEMFFSGTKSLVSVVAGLAWDRGLFRLDGSVGRDVDLGRWGVGLPAAVTWRHLLEQTSGWSGWLWGKPTSADAQDRTRDRQAATVPRTTWGYNDVRVNLLCLALTVLMERALPDVLRDELLEPLGCRGWEWHGYRDSSVDVGGATLPVVSGGAHWGGGLWISSNDLAAVGQLFLQGGSWGGTQLLSRQWVRLSWSPCGANPDYGLLWWLNDARRVWPDAPAGGRCARGNLGRHLLWVDPDRELVVVSRWGEDVNLLLRDVSAVVAT